MNFIRRMQSFSMIDMPHAVTSSIPFTVDAEKLAQVVKAQDVDVLAELGGVDGIMSALESDAELGIPGNAVDLCRRRNVFGSNDTIQKFSISSCLRVVLSRLLDDKAALFAIACAVYLIIVGIKLYGSKEGCDRGYEMLVNTFLFCLVSESLKFCVVRCFKRGKKSEDAVFVLRNGLKQQISSSEVVVGDIVFVKSRGVVPADGLLLLDGDGENHQPLLKLDESHLTTEKAAATVEADSSHPFLCGGAVLLDGHAKMLITGVGKNMVCLGKQGPRCHHDQVMTANLHVLAEVNFLARCLKRLKWISLVSYVLVAIARYFSGDAKDDYGNSLFKPGLTGGLKASHDVTLEIVFTFVMLWNAMDTENFPWAMKISLWCAINDISRHDVIVRNLLSWEKIGLGVATVNVIDEGNMFIRCRVLASKFVSVPDVLRNNIEVPPPTSPNVVDLVRQGICLNTTGIAYPALKTGTPYQFSGSPSERAILSQASLQLEADWERFNQTCCILKVDSSEVQGRRIVVHVEDKLHVHRRGPARMILDMCSSFYDASGMLSCLSEDQRNKLHTKLRRINAIAVAHRIVSVEELTNDSDLKEKENCYNLLGFIPLKVKDQRKLLTRVAEEYHDAGLGLDVIAAKDEAVELARSDNLACEGEDSTESPVHAVSAFKEDPLPMYASPVHEVPPVSDKDVSPTNFMVSEHIINLDSDTNSAWDKDEVNVKSVESEAVVSMGIEDQSSRCSDFVILDGDYSSLMLILQWSNGILNNSRMFLQFQITTCITSMVYTYISSISSAYDQEKVELGWVEQRTTLFQLIWVNIVMGWIAVVAFGRQKPPPPSGYNKMQRQQLHAQQGCRKSKWRLIDGFMLRNVVAQVAYQITVMTILEIKGAAILGLDEDKMETITTVTAIFLQAFNLVNARKMEEKNIFSGIRVGFICVVAAMVAAPVVGVEVMHALESLRWGHWALCMGIGMGTWPVAFGSKYVPVQWVIFPFTMFTRVLS